MFFSRGPEGISVSSNAAEEHFAVSPHMQEQQLLRQRGVSEFCETEIWSTEQLLEVQK